jgi:hypothetical protein
MQDEKAVKHDPESENAGTGFEHHLPHLYSQVGVAEVTILEELA